MPFCEPITCVPSVLTIACLDWFDRAAGWRSTCWCHEQNNVGFENLSLVPLCNWICCNLSMVGAGRIQKIILFQLQLIHGRGGNRAFFAACFAISCAISTNARASASRYSRPFAAVMFCLAELAPITTLEFALAVVGEFRDGF